MAFGALVGGFGKGLANQVNTNRELADREENTDLRAKALESQQLQRELSFNADQDELAETEFRFQLDAAVGQKGSLLQATTKDSFGNDIPLSAAEISQNLEVFRETALSLIETRFRVKPGSSPEATDKAIREHERIFDQTIANVLSPEDAARSEAGAAVAGATQTAQQLGVSVDETAGAANLTQFDQERVNIRDRRSNQVITFIVNDQEDKARLDGLLRSGDFSETTRQGTPGKFTFITDPVSKRMFIVDSENGDIRPLRVGQVPLEEQPDIVKEGPKTLKTEGEVVTQLSSQLSGGDLTFMTPPDEGAPREALQQIPVIMSLEDIGIPGRVKDLIGNTFGLAIDELAFPKRGAEKQRLADLRTKIKLALTLSSRPPVMEQQQLQDRVPDPDTVFENTPRALASVGQLALILQSQVTDDIKFFNDRNNPPDQRAQSVDRIRGVRSILDTIGVVTNRQEDVDAFAPGQIFLWVDSFGEAVLVQKEPNDDG